VPVARNPASSRQRALLPKCIIQNDHGVVQPNTNSFVLTCVGCRNGKLETSRISNTPKLLLRLPGLRQMASLPDLIRATCHFKSQDRQSTKSMEQVRTIPGRARPGLRARDAPGVLSKPLRKLAIRVFLCVCFFDCCCCCCFCPACFTSSSLNRTDRARYVVTMLAHPAACGVRGYRAVPTRRCNLQNLGP